MSSDTLPDISPHLARTDPIAMEKFNRLLIAQYLANNGRLTGLFEHVPVLLLTTVGAKTSQVRTTPLTYLRDGEDYVVMASKSGAAVNPAWYHNLMAAGTAAVQIGSQSFQVRAIKTEGDERDRLFALMARLNPAASQYQQVTSRQIPMIVLRHIQPVARFVVMYDVPSDIEAFERHYREVHIPLAKQLPGLRRYTISHNVTPVIGAPYYLVAMLDWDDLDALGAAFGSDIGTQTARDVTDNLVRYATMRSMILQLDDK
ncbi:nitroreductase/quinone reductase family protein [Nocardia sp. NPDC020380]|uniref:nitroreductase/quinone reductase family protein n=1 Tax=Nocardia sp. NPDC020380 TaxID=3364309 RepID=UPI003789ECD8